MKNNSNSNINSNSSFISIEKYGPDPYIGGAKRKNGHKFGCTCHICENIKNKAKRGGYEEDMKKRELKKMGGSRKKNGHKPDCNCPICKNMKNSKNKKGGNEDSDSDSDSSSSSDDDEYYTGGKKNKKRGNGHKPDCNYPICKNMKNSKNKKGGDEPDIENQKGDEEEGGIKADKNMLGTIDYEIPADAQEYDELDLAERGEAGTKNGGGTRKKKFFRKYKTRKSARGRKTKRRYRKQSNNK